MADNAFNFQGGSTGQWRILKMQTLLGEPLQPATHLNISQTSPEIITDNVWTLKGLVSNLRYTERHEKEA
jgi:hypothetical protein